MRKFVLALVASLCPASFLIAPAGASSAIRLGVFHGTATMKLVAQPTGGVSGYGFVFTAHGTVTTRVWRLSDGYSDGTVTTVHLTGILSNFTMPSDLGGGCIVGPPNSVGAAITFTNPTGNNGTGSLVAHKMEVQISGSMKSSTVLVNCTYSGGESEQEPTVVDPFLIANTNSFNPELIAGHSYRLPLDNPPQGYAGTLIISYRK